MKEFYLRLLALLKKKFRFEYYWLKYLPYVNFKIDVVPESKSVLLICHEMTKTGAPVLLLHIAKHLAKNGWDVHVITKLSGPLIPEFSVFSRVYVVKHPNAFKSRLEFLAEQGVEHAIVNSVASGDWTPFIKQAGMEIVTLVHEMANVIDVLGLIPNAEIISRNSDFLVFPSNYVRESFESVTKIQCESRIITQGLYLKPDVYPDKAFAKSRLRDKFKLRKNTTIIINVATGNYRKGFDIFIEMAAKEQGKEFIWVGDYDARLYNSATENYPAEKLSNLRLPGYLDSKEELFELYAGSDVLALTSREEPFGSIVLEAFSSGLPVAGFSGAGGFQDIVKTSETGWLAAEFTPDSMLMAINSLVDDEDLYLEISENARSVSERFDFSFYVKSIFDLYERT